MCLSQYSCRDSYFDPAPFTVATAEARFSVGFPRCSRVAIGSGHNEIREGREARLKRQVVFGPAKELNQGFYLNQAHDGTCLMSSIFGCRKALNCSRPIVFEIQTHPNKHECELPFWVKALQILPRGTVFPSL